MYWNTSASGTVVSVPKTSVYEDRFPHSREYQVRFAGKILVV